MTAPVLVVTHTPTEQAALAIADAAVDAGLAAAAQVLGPARSIYRWRGDTHRTEEWVCSIKTTEGRFEALEDLIRTRHPYELPAVFAIPVTAGGEAYLGWWREAGDVEA